MAPADLRRFVRDIPDFPRPGILFEDITPLLLDASALDEAVGELAAGAGAEIAACVFLIELSFLGGRARLAPYQVHSLIDFPS
jgi:adenine phosphoribosyltransferase